MNVLWRSGTSIDHLDEAILPAGTEIRVETDPAAALEYADWAEILVDGSPPETLLDGRRLGHVIVPYAGVGEDLRAGVEARPHLKLYNSHFNASFVAQHAVALLMACANRICEADTAMRRGDWLPRFRKDFDSLELTGRTCLLLGFGAIGQEIRTRVEGLGMRVAAYRRRPVPTPGIETYGPSDLDAALQGADAIISSLPGTPETAGLLGADAFKAMKPSAILVNVGRATVIDPEALFQALKGATIASAGLDVWWRYPEDRETRASTFQDQPFQKLDNIVLSPHRAFHNSSRRAACVHDVAQTIAGIAAGESRNEVAVARGY